MSKRYQVDLSVTYAYVIEVELANDPDTPKGIDELEDLIEDNLKQLHDTPFDREDVDDFSVLDFKPTDDLVTEVTEGDIPTTSQRCLAGQHVECDHDWASDKDCACYCHTETPWSSYE